MRGRLSLPRGQNGWHARFEASRHEGFARDDAGNAAVEDATTRFHCALMALTMTQRPFVLEKIQGVVCACEGALQTALQPDSHRLGP
ncbi:hypothetical protein RLV_0819 (plasmid) [Rhizobium leguminosarum bv. viciae]|nr:hypothetical protein RLV_0819 [Rhizobium leguminosarum bv. viciae]